MITRRTTLVWMCVLALLFVGAAAMRVATPRQPPPEIDEPAPPPPGESPPPEPTQPAPPSPSPSPSKPSPGVTGPQPSPTGPASPEPSEPEPPEPSESEPEPTEPPEPSPEPTQPEPEPPDPEPSETPGEVALAPDFTVTDRNGNPVRLSDLRGAPVVFNFWASWCEPCVAEMDALEAVWRDYGTRVAFVMINIVTYETVGTATHFIDSNGYTFPIYFDTEGKQAAAAYEATRFPTTVWISAAGEVVSTRVGMMHEDMMRERIQLILP